MNFPIKMTKKLFETCPRIVEFNKNFVEKTIPNNFWEKKCLSTDTTNSRQMYRWYDVTRVYRLRLYTLNECEKKFKMATMIRKFSIFDDKKKIIQKFFFFFTISMKFEYWWLKKISFYSVYLFATLLWRRYDFQWSIDSANETQFTLA